MTMEEAKNLLAIDRNNLHVDCEKHPSIFFQVCEQYSMAVDKRDSLKEQRDRLYAELFAKIKNGEGKVSDALADSKVIASEEYNAIVEKYLEAKKEADVWLALKDAFIQKGHALKMLVDLFVFQYYNTTFDVTTRNVDKIKEKLKNRRG